MSKNPKRENRTSSFICQEREKKVFLLFTESKLFPRRVKNRSKCSRRLITRKKFTDDLSCHRLCNFIFCNKTESRFFYESRPLPVSLLIHQQPWFIRAKPTKCIDMNLNCLKDLPSVKQPARLNIG